MQPTQSTPGASWHAASSGEKELNTDQRSATGVPEITSFRSELLGIREEFYISAFIFGPELSSLEMQKIVFGE